jgi:hypothetical protein
MRAAEVAGDDLATTRRYYEDLVHRMAGVARALADRLERATAPVPSTEWGGYTMRAAMVVDDLHRTLSRLSVDELIKVAAALDFFGTEGS